MGVWKHLDGENNPVIGQEIIHRDRDFADEHHELPIPAATAVQLELPFEQPLKSLPDQNEIRRRADELFENFKIVLKGKDVDIHHKRQVLSTILGNYKNGSVDIATRSHELILDVFTEFWKK
jgi:hypothetical protein